MPCSANHFIQLARKCKRYHNLTKNIENDFITMQKVAREKGQASDDGSELLNLLILAESMCKSYGKRQLEQDIWDKVKRMEQERLGRIANALKK